MFVVIVEITAEYRNKESSFGFNFKEQVANKGIFFPFVQRKNGCVRIEGTRSACGEKEKPGRITADNLPKGKVLLSSLSNEELYKFITEHGATIPEECADMDFKSVIASLENDIYSIHELTISYEDARIKLIKEINDIVREYYGYPTFYNRETSEK